MFALEFFSYEPGDLGITPEAYTAIENEASHLRTVYVAITRVVREDNDPNLRETSATAMPILAS